jgi:hypothetical protein
LRDLTSLLCLYASAEGLLEVECDAGPSVAADAPDRVNLKDEEERFQRIVDATRSWWIPSGAQPRKAE